MKISFDNITLGNLNITPPDDKVKEYVEAIIMLGFEPEVTFD